MRFDRQHVLKKVLENKQDHIDQYSLLLQQYVEAAKGRFQKELNKADQLASNGLRLSAPSVYVTMTGPSLEIDGYDTAIDMLEETVDVEIELDENEYKEYVLDKKSWRHQFPQLRKLYSESTTRSNPKGD